MPLSPITTLLSNLFSRNVADNHNPLLDGPPRVWWWGQPRGAGSGDYQKVQPFRRQPQHVTDA